MYWDNDAFSSGGPGFHNRIHRYWMYLLGVPSNEHEVVRVNRNASGYAIRESNEVFDKGLLDRIDPNGSDGTFYEIDDKFWIHDDGHQRLANQEIGWDYAPSNSPGAENPVSYHNNFVPKSRESEYDFGPLIEWCRQLETQGASINQNTVERMADIRALAAYAAIRAYSVTPRNESATASC